MDNVSLTKIICHRNFGNEFGFTHSKHYLYYLARSPLSQIFNKETSPQTRVYTSICFCDPPTLSKKKCPWEPGLIHDHVTGFISLVKHALVNGHETI